MVSVAGVAIGLLFLLQFAVFPIIDSRDRYMRGIAAKQEALDRVAVLSSEYEAYRADSLGIKQRLARRPAGFTLFSFLEKAAGETDIKNHIKYMKPSAAAGKGPFNESLVEMKLEGITLKQLTGYLQRIESPEDIVSIRRISIQVSKNEAGYLDAVLQVLTYS